ncbi:MAG: hypothetical protein V1733_00800 [bacterium]
MFDELKPYKHNGHFFFQPGNKLSEVSKGVPELPGVYLIYRLSGGRVELVYIRASGTMQQNGRFLNQLLKGRINNKQDGIGRQEFFEKKLKDEHIDGLDIYWYVTFDKQIRHLPAFVEANLMQRFFEIHGGLPEWNKEF